MAMVGTPTQRQIGTQAGSENTDGLLWVVLRQLWQASWKRQSSMEDRVDGMDPRGPARGESTRSDWQTWEMRTWGRWLKCDSFPGQQLGADPCGSVVGGIAQW